MWHETQSYMNRTTEKPAKYVDLVNNITYITNMTEELRDKLESAFCNGLDEYFGQTFEQEEELDLNVYNIDNFIYSHTKKSVGAGAWVKVKTDIGYNVYYAKPVAPKTDIFSLRREMSKLTPYASDDKKTLDLKKKKMDSITYRYDLMMFSGHIGIQPYYIQIKVAKNKYNYLLPTQYELASDVELYQNVILAEGKDMGVTFKEIYKSNDENIIHYIMSRGIPKDEAIMMAKLKEIYFIVDVAAIMQKVIQPV